MWAFSGTDLQKNDVMTNYITDPTGVLWLATTDMGYYWAGFGTGMIFLGFNLIMRMALRTGKHTSDF